MFYAIKVDVLEGKSDVSAATSHPLLASSFFLRRQQRGFLCCAFRGYAPFKGLRRWLHYTHFRNKLQYNILRI